MKVLDITGNPFSRFLNNGKTHEAIFSAFAKEELCQLYVRPVPIELIDFDYCSSYYCVSDWDVLKKITFQSQKCGSHIVYRKNVDTKDVDKYSGINRNNHFSKNGLLGVIRDIVWSTNVWKNNELIKWLMSESPDLIFIDGGGDCFLYNICIYIRKLLNIPIVYYVTDDYIIHTQTNTILQKLHCYKLKKSIQRVVESSSQCYAIGEKMADEYSSFFNKSFDYVMNSIDVLPYVQELSPDKLPIVISYFGSLGLNRGNMIAELGRLSKGRFVINVYSFAITNEMESLFKNSGVIYKGSVKGDDLENAMYDSNVLLHVESDDTVNRAFTMLAVSTKIPEYLMHSRIILGFGPPEVASMELLSRNKIGVCINSGSSIEEKENTISLLLDKKYRERIASNGYAYALSHFDKKKNAVKIKSDFISLLDNESR